MPENIFVFFRGGADAILKISISKLREKALKVLRLCSIFYFRDTKKIANFIDLFWQMQVLENFM